MSIAKRLNLVMVSAFALLLGCLMFTSLDTAWGLTYQEGDVWIGTDGEQMTPEEASQWVYEVVYTSGNNLIKLLSYNGEFREGSIIGYVPTSINGNTVYSMFDTFKGCIELINAPVIPDSVTQLHGTFSGCSNLINAPTIPERVLEMYETFKDCTSLKVATPIPNSVTRASYAFEGCTSLETAPAIGNSVSNMAGIFKDCTNLKTAARLPDSVVDIQSAFYNCSSLVTPPNIPDSVTNMNKTFQGCTSLRDTPTLGSSVKNMQYTFHGCKNLTTPPIIPDSVTSMICTFDECQSLYGSIFIPDSVTLALALFCDCTENEITVQYTPNNTVIPGESFTPNITKEEVPSRPAVTDPSPDEGEDEEQDPTTPSNPGETSGNMSIYGTVQPITMIDVTVPLTIQFTIESDRTFTGPDSIEIKSNCPSPLDVNLYGVNKDGSAPSLVAPDTHSDDEWNNLSRAETLASIALMLDNTSLSSTGSTLGRIDSAFQSEKALDLDLSAKYGKAWDNSEDLVFTYNVVFEFAMP